MTKLDTASVLCIDLCLSLTLMWTRRAETENKSIHPPVLFVTSGRRLLLLLLLLLFNVPILLYESFFVVNVGFSGVCVCVCVCVCARACVRLIVIFVALCCAGFVIGHCGVKLVRRCRICRCGGRTVGI